MTYTKDKIITLRLTDEMLKNIEKCLHSSNCSCVSEFVRRSIEFYLTIQNN